MLNKLTNSESAQLSSLGTSTHETGKVLTGNPFTDLADSGLNLHFALLRYYKGKNNNKHSITGIFNLNGRFYTCGANSYAEIIDQLLAKYREYRRYVEQCHLEKQERYWKNRIARATRGAYEVIELKLRHKK